MKLLGFFNSSNFCEIFIPNFLSFCIVKLGVNLTSEVMMMASNTREQRVYFVKMFLKMKVSVPTTFQSLQ
jgi:hypothetical protein